MVLTYKGLQKLRACMTNSTWKWICVLFSVDSVAVTQWSPTPLSGVQILFGALNMKDIIKACTCTQCKAVRKKRKNRKLKKMLKRKLNKKRRKSDFKEIVNFYWA